MARFIVLTMSIIMVAIIVPLLFLCYPFCWRWSVSYTHTHACACTNCTITMPPIASRSMHGRRVRKKGRAGAIKQISESSDSSEKRLNRRLIAEEEEMKYEERLERCRQNFECRQAKIEDIHNRKGSLRSVALALANDTKSEISTAIVPLSISISSASASSIESQKTSSMSSLSSYSSSNNKEINKEKRQQSMVVVRSITENTHRSVNSKEA